ncbi:MAG TPA: hypothetical protein VFC19_44100 [Candidatus Limnocylindrales bacterium]|nr:hypothetical protein [Candidatus Limnocylindrales bacterium]
MGDEVNADLERMRWLARQIDDAAAGLYDGSGAVPEWVFEGWPVAESALGNSTGASAFHKAWEATKNQLGAASRNLWQVLGSDVARLEQVVRTFDLTDADTADRVCAAGKQITFMSAHVHSGGGVEDDFVRGDQIHEVVDIADEFQTPGFVGADLNEQLGDTYGDLRGNQPDSWAGDENYSSEAISSFDDRGYTDVGPSAPTSNEGEGQRIDHMRSRGLVVTDARVVDGGPSDHQAQAAEVTVPWW